MGQLNGPTGRTGRGAPLPRPSCRGSAGPPRSAVWSGQATPPSPEVVVRPLGSVLPTVSSTRSSGSLRARGGQHEAVPERNTKGDENEKWRPAEACYFGRLK